MSMNINDFYLPLKEDIPTLLFDVAEYCNILKNIIPGPLPRYLHKYRDKIYSYSKQVEEVNPQIYPKAYRVYIFDYRVNILFATLDYTGEIATFFSKFGKWGHDIGDYYYGDGELIGDVIPGQGHNVNQMQSFKKKYGFLPIEELAMSAGVVFGDDVLEERRLLSSFQVEILMEKYRDVNLVDWNRILNETVNGFPL